MPKSIDIIRGEHRALASVLNALREIVDGVAAGRFQPDFQLLSAMMVYIADVPEIVHHPKEDDHLFARMKQRSPDAGVIIDRLEKEHVEGYALTRELEHALVPWQGLGQGAFAQFQDCATRYLDFNWRHLNTEEDELLPLARRDLKPDDWAEIDAAFAANFDPFAGPNREYAALFDRIVDLAPAPIGHGGSPRA
ncbi:MAG TPA: hemerythrin domain-containing protein [Beijerinckiaceae bacterium]|nr:hemerythrin domain-containing protein [Rhodoblastus sp.]MCB9998238.1 hemerythrin domain-containing protein [Methylobacteriaceae bacterium]HPG02890.1 hemerythrin domain-containing protein [Rhodoblastus sp.]HRY04559.1 hemerythrin domain-containing protein [Beijerinckiaceae bacterium]